ncbi:MAG: hypothetical protein M1606_00015, partial [Candidatus Thermoplasmatota archaeon]|nr:hypothetical protein [Candidatus Thermoplasmatota archaeon]
LRRERTEGFRRLLSARLEIAEPSVRRLDDERLQTAAERLRRARVANRIVEEEVERAIRSNELARPWQYFAVLLPVRTVGVLGDNRFHGEAVSVRIVDSIDAMTARSVALPHAVGARIAERITRELAGEVVRVLYDLSDKPPATIEWE